MKGVICNKVPIYCDNLFNIINGFTLKSYCEVFSIEAIMPTVLAKDAVTRLGRLKPINKVRRRQ